MYLLGKPILTSSDLGFWWCQILLRCLLPLAEPPPGQGATHHEDAPVAVTVDAPELEVCLGLHGSRSGGAIDESQLPEASPLADVGHPFPVHIDLGRTGEKGQWDTWLTTAASSMGEPTTIPRGKDRCFSRLLDHFVHTPALEVTLGRCDLPQGASVPFHPSLPGARAGQHTATKELVRTRGQNTLCPSYLLGWLPIQQSSLSLSGPQFFQLYPNESLYNYTETGPDKYSLSLSLAFSVYKMPLLSGHSMFPLLECPSCPTPLGTH